MFNSWIRTNKWASYLLTIIRIYIGYEWMKSGVGKIFGGFDASGFLSGAIAKSTGEFPAVQSWWAAFLDHVVLPGVKFFNILIPLGETLVGLGLIIGTFTTFAALMGIVMNTAYLLSGTVSTNVQMLILETFILVGGANSGRIGLDYWVMPYIRNLIPKNNNNSTSSAQSNQEDSRNIASA